MTINKKRIKFTINLIIEMLKFSIIIQKRGFENIIDRNTLKKD